MSKKIRESEKEWVPFTIVIGEKEVGKLRLPVRVRETVKMKDYSPGELIDEIQAKTEGKPWRPLPLPKHLQARPKFVG